MAEIKISALPSGTPKGTDLTPATDTTDTSSAASGTTKKYVRSGEFNFYVTAMGVRTLTACRLATAAALTATYANGVSGVGATLTNSGAMAALTIDGVAVAVADRILVKNQATAVQNGIYTVTTIGSGAVNWVLTRATDYDQAAEVQQFDVVLINQGTVNAGLAYQESNAGPFTMGTTDITFILFNINKIINPSPAVANKLLRSDGTNWVVSTNASLDASDVLSGLTQLNVDNLRLDGNTISSTDANGNINILPNGTGWVNIANSTWNPQSLLTVAKAGDNAEIAYGTFENSSSGPTTYYYKSRSTSISGFVTLQAGDTIGQSAFYGDDGAAFQESAVIKVVADAGIGAGLMPSKMEFYTTNTAGVVTLAATITAAQVFTLANALLVASGGSGRATATAYALIAGGTTATGAHQSLTTGTAGQFLTSGGAAAVPTWTTATFPATAGSAGTILRSNGTNWVNSTSTFADTYTASNILYSNGANTVTGLATGNNGVLITSAGGVPSISSTLPSTVQTNITALGTIAQNLEFTPVAAGSRYIIFSTNTDGAFILQAGVGSAAAGGGYVMYGSTHATFPGWTKACISGQGGSKFAINDQGIGGGTDVLTCDRAGSVVIIGSLTTSQTAGIVGTTTNNDAVAGAVGQLISSVVLSGAAVALTTATSANITSISLTAGDWDVSGEVWTNPAAGTTTSKVQAAVSQTSATLPTVPAVGTSLSILTGIVSGATESIVLGTTPTRISLAGTTTIYLVANVSFAVSTMGGYGKIEARRRR